MASVLFEGDKVEIKKGDTVLEALEAAGHDIPNSCRAGMCQACIMTVVSGDPGEEAQETLDSDQVKDKQFLACCSMPSGDIEASFAPYSANLKTKVLESKLLDIRTLLLRLSVPNDFEYKAGQFINLIRSSDGLMRSYSIASVPSEEFIELHIRCFDDGKMSSWLKNEVKVGEELEFTGANGKCYYTTEKPDQELVLAGIGTGMAPLYGIARQALAEGHKGKVTIIQGARDERGLYYTSEFDAVAKQFENCTYISSTVDGSGDDSAKGSIDEVVAQNFPSMEGKKVFLCGSPNTVGRLTKYSLSVGASENEVLSDPFTAAGA